MPTANDLRNFTTDQLFDSMSGCQPGAPLHGMYVAELERRKFERDAQVAAEQIKSANWQGWSAVIQAISVVVAVAGLLVVSAG